MKNVQEQTKQKIILELEHALLSAFLVPLAVLFVSIVFTHQYFDGQNVMRYIFGLLIFFVLLLLVLFRKSCIHRAKKYIDKL